MGSRNNVLLATVLCFLSVVLPLVSAQHNILSLSPAGPFDTMNPPVSVLIGHDAVSLANSRVCEIVGVGFAPCTIVDATTTDMAPLRGTGAGHQIRVSVGGIASANANTLFSYKAPTVTSIDPAAVPTAANDYVYLHGSGFGYLDPTPIVDIGGTPCATLTWTSDTLIVCKSVTTGTASTTTKVTIDSQVSATFPVPYAAPIVSGLSRFEVPSAGGDILTVLGLNFGATNIGPAITVAHKACTPVTYISDSLLACVTPSGGGSGLSISVTVGGLVSVVNHMLNYEVGHVTSVAPTVLDESGGEVFTVLGTNFGHEDNTPSVTFEQFSCVTPTLVSQTKITCTTPPFASSEHWMRSLKVVVQDNLAANFTAPVLSGLFVAVTVSETATIPTGGGTINAGALAQLTVDPSTFAAPQSITVHEVLPEQLSGGDALQHVEIASVAYLVMASVFEVNSGGAPYSGPAHLQVKVHDTRFTSLPLQAFSAPSVGSATYSPLAMTTSGDWLLVDVPSDMVVVFVTPAPTIVNFSPSLVYVNDTLLISGTGFSVGSFLENSVSMTSNGGATSCASMTVNSNSSITCVLGFGTSGNVRPTISVSCPSCLGTLMYSKTIATDLYFQGTHDSLQLYSATVSGDTLTLVARKTFHDCLHLFHSDPVSGAKTILHVQNFLCADAGKFNYPFSMSHWLSSTLAPGDWVMLTNGNDPSVSSMVQVT